MKKLLVKGVLNKIIFISILSALTVIAIVMFSSSEKNYLDTIRFFDAGMCFICMFGILVISIIGFFDRAQNNKTSTFLYYLILLILFIEFFSEIMTYCFLGANNRALSHLFNTIIYLIAPAITFVFWLYETSLYRPDQKKDPLITVIVFSLSMIATLYVVLNNFFGYAFTIDEFGFLVKQPLEFLTLLGPAAILGICLVSNISVELTTHKKIPLIAFCSAPIVAGIASMFANELSILYPTMFLMTIFVYGTIQLERNIDLAKYKVEVIQKEQEIMISQIQPHFLYNTLASISALCDIDPELARETTDKFSDYLRGNMNSLKRNGPIDFSEELNHVKIYTWIEETRFKNKLKVEFDIQYTEFKIPALTLQPIVENAIKHGVCAKRSGGTVKISTKLIDKKIYIEVKDDGVGFDVNAPKKTDRIHLGIDNTRARLQDMVGGTLDIQSEIGVGTVSTIIIERR